MKIRRLPDIDLARIAPMPSREKRNALEAFKLGIVTITYAPVRSRLPDLFNVQPALFGEAAPTDWDTVERLVTRQCRSDDEKVANLLVASALHQFANDHDIFSRQHDFYPMAMRVGQQVEYWLRLVTLVDDSPMVLFVDPRRSRRLSEVGRRFAFSMMHERIRVADPDMSEVRLGIVQLGAVKDGRRVPRLYTDERAELYNFDDLEAMVGETYEIWRDVSERRDDETRRKASGTRGPLI
ncbi:MAG: hypothetical protein JWP34_5430 [Massilia sp.]|nr:hypothetical protein [Massilia sp.]